ncbi:DNA-binding protein [Chytridium lagenaria]|nr:DNA-binding protein [Chytridium lagenaria]
MAKAVPPRNLFSKIQSFGGSTSHFRTSMQRLSQTLIEMMEAIICEVLSHRRVYPSDLFESCKKHGVGTIQSRHPELKQYIRDFLDGIYDDLHNGNLKSVRMIVYEADVIPIESFVFRLDIIGQHARNQSDNTQDVTALDTFFSTCIRRIHNSDQYLRATPSGADRTFRLFCELKGQDSHPGSYLNGVPWIMAMEEETELRYSQIIH